jgi:uncharacterized protein DUF4231
LTLFRHRPADRYEPLKEEMLALCASQAESRYITDRWLERLKTAYAAGHRARDHVYVGRFLSIGAATVLPAVVSAQAAFRTGWWTVAAVGLSLVVALSGGFVEITRSRQRWQLYRRLRGELETAGWELCFQPTEAPGHGFDHFRARVEAALPDFQRGYLDEIANPPEHLDTRTSGPDERST